MIRTTPTGNLESETTSQEEQMSMIDQKDPVCGMDVSPDRAAAKSEHNGQTYYFCSKQCKQKFDRSPEQYTRQSA
jgi:Cu+-exporting ATPase